MILSHLVFMNNSCGKSPGGLSVSFTSFSFGTMFGKQGVGVKWNGNKRERKIEIVKSEYGVGATCQIQKPQAVFSQTRMNRYMFALPVAAKVMSQFEQCHLINRQQNRVAGILSTYTRSCLIILLSLL